MRQSIRPDIYASILVTLVPAVISFGLRFYARRIKHVSLWWDDHLAVVGFVSFAHSSPLKAFSLIYMFSLCR